MRARDNQKKGRAAFLLAFFICTPFLCVRPLRGQDSDKLALESQHAKQLMAERKFSEAVLIYKKLVAAVPGNAGLLFDLGLAEHMAGDDRAAAEHLATVVKAQPKFVPGLVTLASARLSLGEPAKAVAPLEGALAAEPSNVEARGMLAGALMAAGRPLDAAAQYRKISDTAPRDARAWYGLGKSYEAAAAGLFEKLQKDDLQSAYVSALVADTRVRRGQYRSANFFYQEALKKQPGLRGVHGGMAEVYKKTGHPDWAAAEQAKEQALAPPDCSKPTAECAFVAGHDLQALADGNAKPSKETLFWQIKAANELALQAFFQLGQLPPSVESHRLQAEILTDQNRPLQAVKEWEAAAALAPGDPRIQEEIAVAYFTGLDYKNALERALQLLKVEPASPQMNFIAGDSLVRMEQPEKAVPYLKAALASDPKMLAADASLGLALSRLGKNEEAVPRLERSISLDEDGSLHYQLARAYQGSGQTEKARAAMQQYQAIVKLNQEHKDEAARESEITAPQQ